MSCFVATFAEFLVVHDSRRKEGIRKFGKYAICKVDL